MTIKLYIIAKHINIKNKDNIVCSNGCYKYITENLYQQLETTKA